MKFLEKNIDLGLLILRVSLGFLMLLHGMSKLSHGVDMIGQMLAGKGFPEFFAYGVYVGEVIAPIFLIAGVASRLAALVIVVNCIVAAMLAHMSMLFMLSEQGGWAIELLGLYFFGALALVFTGGGNYSLSNKYLWD